MTFVLTETVIKRAEHTECIDDLLEALELDRQCKEVHMHYSCPGCRALMKVLFGPDMLTGVEECE